MAAHSSGVYDVVVADDCGCCSCSRVEVEWCRCCRDVMAALVVEVHAEVVIASNRAWSMAKNTVLVVDFMVVVRYCCC